MRVQVSTGYTYEAPEDVSVGDEVHIPAALGFEDIYPAQWVRVTSLEPSYTGPCRMVLGIRHADSQEES